MIKHFLLIPFFVLNIVLAQTSDCGTEFSAEWAGTLKSRIAALQTFSLNKAQINYVPFQIHLVKKYDSTSVLSLQDIYNEIDSVNFFYSNANIQFVECSAPEIIYDDSLYTFENNPDQNVMLSQHYAANIINMYFPNTVTKSGVAVCGYAPLPASLDYIFISGSCATNGSTLAHELGHYFGLLHTHGGSSTELVNGSNCSTEGDLICDTPADPTLSSSNVTSACVYTGTDVDANSMTYVPDVTNVMSYSRKSCRTSFTAQQYGVINNTYLVSRNYLACMVTAAVGLEALPLLTVFPNPVQEQLNFHLEKHLGSCDLRLLDVPEKLFIAHNSPEQTSKL